MKQALVISIIIILSGCMYVNAQNLAITGNAIDSNGAALPWASVARKNEIALNNQQTINATLTKSIINNSEVVAIAYGNGKKTGTSAIEIPNAYKGDNNIEIPNAYNPNKDESIKMPNARLIEPNPEDSAVIINKITPKFLPNPEN